MRTGDRWIQGWRMSEAARWIPPRSRLLDIGCHQGELFEYLGDRIAPSVGIDPLYEHDRRPTRHQFLACRAEDPLPFLDHSFDIVILLAVMEHITDKEYIAGLARRLLCPGGRVIVTAPAEAVDRILHSLIQFRLVDGMSLEEHHGFDPSQLPTIFENAGFVTRENRKFQFGLNNLFVFDVIGTG